MRECVTNTSSLVGMTSTAGKIPEFNPQHSSTDAPSPSIQKQASMNQQASMKKASMEQKNRWNKYRCNNRHLCDHFPLHFPGNVPDHIHRLPSCGSRISSVQTSGKVHVRGFILSLHLLFLSISPLPLPLDLPYFSSSPSPFIVSFSSSSLSLHLLFLPP